MDATKPPDPGNTSIRFGRAFLRPHKDKDHYELMRPLVTVVNEGGRITTQAHGDPIQLGIYRLKRQGDKAPAASDMVADGPPPEMRTSDPKTNQPMTLVLVWWPGKG